MTFSGKPAAGILAVAIAAAAVGAPALAQTPAAQVALVEGDANGDYRALGVVSATVHQRSIFPKTPIRQQLDDALRAEAAKLGADAVIQVKYDLSNALTSKDGQKASGVAVRFTRTQMAAAAPAPTAAPPVVAAAPPPASVAAPPAVVAAPTPAPAAPPTVVAVAPPPAPPPVIAAAPPAAAAAAPAVTAPAAPRPAPTQPAVTAAAIVLSEQGMPGQQLVRLGEVSAVTHQTSLFPKTPRRQALQDALRAEAAKLGADAVIEVKYDMSNALTSKQGNRATGVAVRFGAAAAAPVAAPPAVAAAAPAAVPAAPAVVAAAPAPAAAAPAVAAQPRRAVSAAQVVLAEQDLAGQRYVRIGEVSAVTHQRSIFPKEPPRVTLQNALRAEAHKLGADAVIMVKYDMSNALTSKDGNRATGIAVRYE